MHIQFKAKHSLGLLGKLPDELLRNVILPDLVSSGAMYRSFAPLCQEAAAVAIQVAAHVESSCQNFRKAAALAALGANGPSAALQPPKYDLNVERAANCFVTNRARRNNLYTADELIAEGKPGEANRLLQRLAANSGANAEVFFRLGLTHLQLGHPSDAITAFERAVALKPAHFQATMGLADVVGRQGELERSNALLLAASALRPELGSPHLHRGINLYNQHKYSEAKEALNRALGLEPCLSGTYLWLGKTHQSLGDTEAAEHALRQGLAIWPGQADMLYELAKLLRATGRSTEALGCARRANVNHCKNPTSLLRLLISLMQGEGHAPLQEYYVRLFLKFEPHDMPARRALFFLLYNRSAHEEAIPWGKSLINAEPTDAQVHAVLGKSYQVLGQHEKAVQFCLKAARLAPATYDYKAIAMRMLIDSANWPRLQILAQDSIACDQGRYEGHYSLGLAFMHQDWPAAALQSFETATELNPSNAKVLYDASLAAAKCVRYDRAKHFLLRSIAIDPTSFDSHIRLGHSQRALGELEAAKDTFEEAIRLEPNRIDGYLALGRLSMATGHKAAALFSFRRALFIDEKHPAAAAGLDEARRLA